MTINHLQQSRAVAALYDEADLRDELTDLEAQAVLIWAELQIDCWAEAGLSDLVFDARIASLFELLKAINRFGGRRLGATPEVLRALLDDVATAAPPAGLALAPAVMVAFTQAHQGLPDELPRLLGLLSAPGHEETRP